MRVLLFNKTLVSRIKSLSSMVAPKAIGLVMVTDLIADGGRWSRELMRPVRAFDLAAGLRGTYSHCGNRSQ